MTIPNSPNDSLKGLGRCTEMGLYNRNRMNDLRLNSVDVSNFKNETRASQIGKLVIQDSTSEETAR